MFQQSPRYEEEDEEDDLSYEFGDHKLHNITSTTSNRSNNMKISRNNDLYYEEKNSYMYEILSQLCQCFHWKKEESCKEERIKLTRKSNYS